MRSVSIRSVATFWAHNASPAGAIHTVSGSYVGSSGLASTSIPALMIA